MQILRSKKQYLFCPGPVNVAENVKQAVVDNEVGHREEEFSALLRGLNKKILDLFEINKQDDYQAIIITGSGTSANEAMLSSTVGNKNILIISNGEFGNRLFEISSIHNPNTHFLQFAWGKEIDLTKAEEYLKKHKIDLIAMVHHETSVGILNPIKEMGGLAKKYHADLLVDCVSSAGAEKIDLEKYNITFCSTSAAKAIGSLPGLAFVIGRKDAFEKLQHITAKTAYLNLYKFYHYATAFDQTPNTPAVQLFYALEQAIINILHEGVENRRKKLQDRAELLRVGMKHLGLKFLLEEKAMSSVLTTVLIPKYTTLETLRNKLKEKNIIIYNGKGPLTNKVFQVGNIGDLEIKEILYFLKALREALLPKVYAKTDYFANKN